MRRLKLFFLSALLAVSQVVGISIVPIASTAVTSVVTSTTAAAQEAIMTVAPVKTYGAYSNTDACIRALGSTVSTNDYLSFGDIDNDPDDPRIMYKEDRLGDDHNSTIAGSTIVLSRSTDEGVTWSPLITIRASVVGYNLFDGSVQVIKSGPLKGRVIVNWSQGRVGLNYDVVNPADVYAKYSDDIKSVVDPTTATWSSEYKMFPDYGEKLTTSTTSINLGSGASTQTLTVATGLTNITVNRLVNVASNANFNNHLTGRVTAYNSGTGQLDLISVTRFGSGTLTDWNVSLSRYSVSVGKAITKSDNSLLKVNHWSEGAGYNGYLFESTDGITWTFKAIVWNSSTNVPTDGATADSHEGSLAIDPVNQDIWCFRRSTNFQLLIYSKSTDGGTTWPSGTVSTLPNVGKCPFLFTPNRTIIGIGRATTPGGRTMLWQSSDRVNFTWDYIDDRQGTYLYGGLVQTATKIYASWSVEAENASLVGVSGPTKIIFKEITESIEPPTPPTKYHPWIQNWYDYGKAAGYTLPSSTLLGKLNTLVSSWYNRSALSTTDNFFITKFNDSNLRSMAKVGFKRPWLTLSEGGAPTYGANGFDYDGVDDYLATAVEFNTLENYQQNNASVCFYTDDVGAGNPAFGTGVGNFSNRTQSIFLNVNSSGDVYVNLNNDGSPQQLVGFGGSGFFEMLRQQASNFTVKKSNSDISTVARTSTGRPQASLYLGCERFNGNDLRFFSTTVTGFLYFGGYYRNSKYPEWLTYINSL